ncbi:molybdenum cofactor biosynthesis protein MoaE [Thiothrix eikelboomii]|uniref:molybdenum cofactor biosynthesis protein MoaE n=1 Tax=Thiothrix eikelboomii TaxID=92487 RepID=UPI003BB06BCB
MIAIEVCTTAFDPWQALQQFQQQPAFNTKQSGANAVFVGTMRDFNEGELVQAMRLEHYPLMTQKHLQRLVEQACSAWNLDHVFLKHRVGELLPGEPIVLVAVWSAHRRASFEACRQLMEDLKHQAPFWKQETLNDGSTRWVEKNTVG